MTLETGDEGEIQTEDVMTLVKHSGINYRKKQAKEKISLRAKERSILDVTNWTRLFQLVPLDPYFTDKVKCSGNDNGGII